MGVIYYEQKDEESAQLIQRKIRAENVVREFPISFSFCKAGAIRQLQFRVQLISKSLFYFSIRVINQEKQSVRNHELGRLSKS